MKIAIEASWAQGEPTGLGYYVLGLLHGLKNVAPEHEYFLLHWSKKWIGPDFGPQFQPVSYYCGKAALSMQFRLGRVLKSLDVDLYHATAGTGVPPRPLCPTVCMVHDFVRFQDIMYGSGWNGWLYKKQFTASIRKSNAFVCNSHCTADELRDFFPEVSDRPVRVTPLAAEPMGMLAESRRSHMLCLGGIEDRKGQLFLLDVYRELLKKMPHAPCLLFAGPDRGDGEELNRRIVSYDLTDKVKNLGYVGNDQKRKLYSETILFLMPSKKEGFGMPMLEAMQANAPVVASDIPIFREVGRDACILVDGRDANAWATSICDILGDCQRQKELSINGRSHAKSYTWEHTAELTMELYKELIKTGLRG